MITVLPKIPHEGKIDLFLGGGISNCPNWQGSVLEMLSDTNLNVANPRRAEGLEKVGSEAALQIAWEHDNLIKSENILFWFPEETLCPITLLELGVQMGKLDKRLFVGAHPNYARRFDIIEQLGLIDHPNIPSVIHDSIEGLVDEVREVLVG